MGYACAYVLIKPRTNRALTVPLLKVDVGTKMEFHRKQNGAFS